MLMDFGVDFGAILDAFWDQNRCNFLKDFWTCYFCDSGARLAVNPTSARLQQGRLLPRCPPGGAFLFKKKHPITTPGSQDRGIAGSKGRKHCRGCFTRDLTRRGPLAQRIYGSSRRQPASFPEHRAWPKRANGGQSASLPVTSDLISGHLRITV